MIQFTDQITPEEYMELRRKVGWVEALSNNGFKPIDYVVFVAYLAILIFLGFFLSRSKDGKEKDSKDYFLAGNTLTWWAVGASLIAANISAEQFIGMSGTAFASGIAIAAYELMAAATLIVVGKFLLPVMIEKKIFTIPQFLRERYNPGTGLAFSIFWLFLYVFPTRGVFFGSVVKRLRHRPFTAVTRVRFPSESLRE